MSEYQQDYQGVGEMLRAPFMVAEMLRRAKLVEARAIALAPDAAPYGEGYIASFEVESGVREGKHPRAYATVRNTSPHARHVEFGNGNTPKHRTLGKALDAAGD